MTNHYIVFKPKYIKWPHFCTLHQRMLLPCCSPSYALSDNTYRAMRTERKDQCILISGESGAGKTEASKKILLYYAVTCPTNEHMATLGERLLQSNPVLEVFIHWHFRLICTLSFFSYPLTKSTSFALLRHLATQKL